MNNNTDNESKPSQPANEPAANQTQPGSQPPKAPFSKQPEPTPKPPLTKLEGPLTVMKTLELLLKAPTVILQQIKVSHHSAVMGTLCVIFSVCTIAYGLVLGSFSGAEQWWAAPIKVFAGLLLTSLICLPSLYIFSCLSGADVNIAQVSLILLSGITLTAVILLGFAPVAWVFSQSTNSLVFMGFLHLIFWGICMIFGVRLIRLFTVGQKLNNTIYINVWIFIFILTALQMTTALRPILGKAPTLLPQEKKFFLQHWIHELDEEAREMKKSSKSRRSR